MGIRRRRRRKGIAGAVEAPPELLVLLRGLVELAGEHRALAVRFLRRPENRRRLVEAMERRRALRPLVALGRTVKPEARFLWARLTPGELVSSGSLTEAQPIEPEATWTADVDGIDLPALTLRTTE